MSIVSVSRRDGLPHFGQVVSTKDGVCASGFWPSERNSTWAGRRTGSWSFPLDDAYIYSNYALNAAHGYFLQYNPGEPSGGVTSTGWFLLLWALYSLTAPLGQAAHVRPARFHPLVGDVPQPAAEHREPVAVAHRQAAARSR